MQSSSYNLSSAYEQRHLGVRCQVEELRRSEDLRTLDEVALLDAQEAHGRAAGVEVHSELLCLLEHLLVVRHIELHHLLHHHAGEEPPHARKLRSYSLLEQLQAEEGVEDVHLHAHARGRVAHDQGHHRLVETAFANDHTEPVCHSIHLSLYPDVEPEEFPFLFLSDHCVPGPVAPGRDVIPSAHIGRQELQHLSGLEFLNLLRQLDYRHRAHQSPCVESHILLHADHSYGIVITVQMRLHCSLINIFTFAEETPGRVARHNG